MTAAIRRHRGVHTSALLALSLTLGGCSGSETERATPSPSPQALPPSKVCGGLLSGTGGKALVELRGAEQFVDVEQSNMAELTPSAAARQLRTAGASAPGGKRRYLCLARTDDQFKDGNFNISVAWERLKPGDDKRGSSKPGSSNRRLGFDLAPRTGKPGYVPYANASAASAFAFFACPTGDGKKGGVVLAIDLMSLWLAPLGREDRAPERLVRVIHPVAVKLAQEMGCLAESRLPVNLGELTPLPADN
ncbi:hypothetical protein [Streptomyces sp. NBC_01481]|uniref:hypothetical protein n=1 Tax=Streptomyces sp. NBC_01481 TaxID=2975869 RepID=UPI0022519703|nr:hypothetical protein [Streptomyces sp. NBC_01481]MCX4586721.1 hypothetical protein [Streptomyces sp. NBC_01481]